MSTDKREETIRMYNKLPDSLKFIFPEELKREMDDTPTVQTMLKMVKWLASVVQDAPEEHYFTDAEDTVENMINVLDGVTARMRVVFLLNSEHRTKIMFNRLYGSCQRFCVAYNEAELHNAKKEK